MKKLIDYLNNLPMAEREDFASRCGASFDYLRQIAYGNRRCRESIAIGLERESMRAVTCEELRPDVDWAYLRTSCFPTKDTL